MENVPDCRAALHRAGIEASIVAAEDFKDILEGLRVVNLQGVDLGVVSHLFETGANDVLVVKGERERLIPYTMGEAIREVDLAAGRMVVDWDSDF